MEDIAPALGSSGETELDRIVRRIVERFHSERIVLFGSRAEGRAAADSDAGLLVVKRTDLPFYDRSAAILESLWPLHLPVDLLVFTPEEVAPLESEPLSLVGEILRRGKVLHPRGTE
jgi:predicted nucleotidyltransferase